MICVLTRQVECRSVGNASAHAFQYRLKYNLPAISFKWHSSYLPLKNRFRRICTRPFWFLLIVVLYSYWCDSVRYVVIKFTLESHFLSLLTGGVTRVGQWRACAPSWVPLLRQWQHQKFFGGDIEGAKWVSEGASIKKMQKIADFWHFFLLRGGGEVGRGQSFQGGQMPPHCLFYICA